jgi:hypothetical protein
VLDLEGHGAAPTDDCVGTLEINDRVRSGRKRADCEERPCHSKNKTDDESGAGEQMAIRHG